MVATTTEKDQAVLVLAFGAPHSLEEIGPFLKGIFQGRPIPPGVLEEVRRRYEAIGGGSPLVDITIRQARALEEEFRRRRRDLKVYVAMRYSSPSIVEVVGRAYDDGVRRLLAVVMSPFQSKASTGGYREDVRKGLYGRSDMEVIFLKPWYNHPIFITTLSRRIEEAMGSLKDPTILFTAHSLPEELVRDDPYTHQIDEAIDGILGLIGPVRWALAYQSRGRKGRWLGPDVEEVIEELSRKGEREILVVPLSFVADNIETLYDIDLVCKDKASVLGMHLKRVPAFNDDPSFIEGLARIITEDLTSPCEKI